MSDKKHISQKELDAFLRKKSRQEGAKTVKETVENMRARRPSSGDRTIFLSHNHRDKTIVTKIGLLFNKLGVNLYVDWMDESLPQMADKITAAIIKEKIRTCHRFLFLATVRGLESKWCSWELGIAHSLKDERALAVLPIDTRSGNWRETEYLQLYPEMNFGNPDLDNLTAEDVYIDFREEKITLLSWLST